MNVSKATIRFETIGELYYDRYHALRPGKSEPRESYRDSSSDENRERFDNWFATQAFTDAIDKIDELTTQVKDLTGEINDLRYAGGGAQGDV